MLVLYGRILLKCCREMTLSKYEKYMLALIRDVIKFMVKANVTLV